MARDISEAMKVFDSLDFESQTLALEFLLMLKADSETVQEKTQPA